MGSNDFSLDTIDIITPDHYARNGYPHKEWTYLRKHAPVFRCERPYLYEPLWAIPKHADIITPDPYARIVFPYKKWPYRRRHAPVFRCERPSLSEPFWAITKHADII